MNFPLRRFCKAAAGVAVGHTGHTLLCSPSSDNNSIHRVSRIHDNDKIVHFVRHAEGYHNLAAQNDPANGYLRADLEDAKLTKKGKDQCNVLHNNSRDMLNSVDIVFVSPMNRTLETALYSFPQLQNKVPWMALESLREQTGFHPCDKRKPISVHKQQYQHVIFDYVEDENDPLYDNYIFREPDEEVVKRCKEFLDWLVRRPEKEIVVVTHSAYLRHLFNHVLHTDNSEDRDHYENCEMRSYVLKVPPSTTSKLSSCSSSSTSCSH